MRIWNNLQTKFFLTYSFIFITIMLLVSIPMYVYLKNNIEKSTISRVNESISKVKDRLDERIKQFDVISKLLYFRTDAIGKPAVSYLNDLSSTDDFYESYQLRNTLKNFVTMLSVISPDVYNIRVFTIRGELISNQAADTKLVMPLVLSPRLAPLLKTNGETLLKYESLDPWLPTTPIPVITLSRLLMPWETRAGFLEVQIKAEEILSLDTIKQIKGANLTLFFNNNVVYSSVKSTDALMAETLTAYHSIKQSPSGNMPALNKTVDGKHYVFSQSSALSGLEIMLTVPVKIIFAPLNIFRNVAMATIVLLILFSVSVFYILAHILTNPLKNLKKSIDLIDLDNKQLNVDNKYQMDEINLINRSFRSMNNRLQNSLEETIRFRTLQLQANFDMLQAQINPHFLFNMLGFIQSSAEDKDLEQVHALSRNLLGFFRYSISTKSPVITLEKEVEFTNQFLELMQTRFMHRLSYTLEIDPLLLHIVVPKLTLQPLVENCIHHGLNDKLHTLEIMVRAFIDGESWEIQIHDNGSGFSSAGLTTLNEKVAGYLDRMYASIEGERLSLGGMGIASTISRLKFMFKEAFYYSIGNNPHNGGASIRLRGPLKR